MAGLFSGVPNDCAVPQHPEARAHPERFSASSQIARQLLPSATLPRTSNPAVCARATPWSEVSRATWLAISPRPSSFEASFDTGVVRIVAESYGAHSAAGSHAVSTTAVRGPSSSPAFAIAVAASFDPSTQEHGCVSCARFSSPVIAPSSGIGSRIRSRCVKSDCGSIRVELRCFQTSILTPFAIYCLPFGPLSVRFAHGPVRSGPALRGATDSRGSAARRPSARLMRRGGASPLPRE
jgi:hypothetical protein